MAFAHFTTTDPSQGTEYRLQEEHRPANRFRVLEVRWSTMNHDISGAKATCPECGAKRAAGMTCWEQLGLLLAWEYDDPELAAEHFLTVASYNLQHPAQFTDAALAGLRDAFIEHLDNGLAIDEIRRRVGRVSKGNRRVLRDETERRPMLRAWRLTIMDIYIPDQPAGAAARVRAWAASIRTEF